MNQRRIFSIVALAIMVVSLVFGGNIPVAAQTPKPPPPGGGMDYYGYGYGYGYGGYGEYGQQQKQ